MGYSHLQVRSGYSLMKSSVSIDKLVERAEELGFKSLALTDENVMYGAVSFYRACMQKKINPIIGLIVDMQIDESETEKVILYAKSNIGYQQLIKLSSHIQLQEGSLTREDLSIYLTDIIIVLPLLDSPVYEWLNNHYIDRVKQHLEKWSFLTEQVDFYLGISGEERQIEKELKTVCSQEDISVTAISDVRYILESDQMAYECLQAIRTGTKWNADTVSGPKEQHLADEKEVRKRLAWWPECIETSEWIAAQCKVKLNFEQRMLPNYPVPQGETASSFLKQLCHSFLHERYNQPVLDVSQRLHYELDIIDSMGFSDYFLIVWDFIRYAKEEGIMVGPGRGSAAGSLVAYILGITDIDPIRYNLLFERFLNPERISMPDIDIDFSDQRRDEVIEYVKNKYGPDHVAQIITFGTFASRSILRELIKTMDIDDQDATFILKEIPSQSSKTIVQSVKESSALTSYVKQSKKLQMLFKIAAKLEGLPRNISTHAAGVVISEQPLTNHVPVTRSHGEIYLTQFAMKDLESIGLLKMDFLGLRNLTLMEKIITSINKKETIKIGLKNIPLDDQRTFKLLQQGRTNGVFQLESQGMQNVLTKLVPNDFEDVVAVNALYRPGPMEFIPLYIDRKLGKASVEYPHQDLQPILKNTYGVLVYQEQIMQIASKMAGFSLGQADTLRRAVSKKSKGAIVQEQQRFIEGCIAKGYTKEVADEVFNWIVRFSNYGFNRSHAVAYSMIAYQLAYLKTHFPAHFLAEALSSITGQQDKIHLYIREARELGITLLPPSINKSFGKFTVEKGNLRMGLLLIKGIGHQVIREIIRARKQGPFKHLFDFCLRVPLNIVNRPVIESLILAGAFDETYSNRASLLSSLDQALEQGELFSEFDDQPSLFQKAVEFDVTYFETEAFTQIKQLQFEKELTGLYISSHPLTEYRDTLRRNGYLSLLELTKFIGKNNIATSAVIQNIKTIRTKRGEPMAFVTLSDETDEREAVIFPETYRQINRWLKEEVMVFIKGKPEERNNRVQLLISEISPFDEQNLLETTDERIFIKVKADMEQQALTIIKEIAEEFPGNTPIIVFQENKKATYRLSSKYYLNRNHTCMKKLIATFGKDQVVLKK
ncbi:DNA polymerase III subunit alpha [Aquibacillus kalidii]|uniref:DNA polymerase III subunit alpha n=1 Tax=Aquibacillus kalidii TaxID=2762597 RepID=UPI001648ED84|nr:DNA polymerase III subunit alpha [Aquibacillus kalidii]